MKKQAQPGGNEGGGRLVLIGRSDPHIRSIPVEAIRGGGRSPNGYLSIKCRAVVKGDLPSKVSVRINRSFGLSKAAWVAAFFQ